MLFKLIETIRRKERNPPKAFKMSNESQGRHRLPMQKQWETSTLSSTDISIRQKINKETKPSYTMNQMNLIDAYRIFHPTATEYLSLLSAHVTVLRKDYVLGHKVSLNKFLKMKSDHVSFLTKMEWNYKLT